MKKVKTSVYAALIAAFGLSVSSCGLTDPNVVNALINGGVQALGSGSGVSSVNTKTALINAGASVLTGLVGAYQQKQTGKAQEYSGAYTAQLLTYNKSAKGYKEAGKAVSTTATSTLYVQTNAVGISIPAVTANGAEMSKVSLTNLTANGGVYKLGDNSTVTEGKLTYNGQSYDLANAYVELAYDANSLQYTASIYFNYDESVQQYMYAMNVAFKK